MKEIKLLPINNKIIKKRERINQKKTLHSLKIPKFKEGICVFFFKSSNSSLLLSQRTGLSFFFKARKKKNPSDRILGPHCHHQRKKKTIAFSSFNFNEYTVRY